MPSHTGLMMFSYNHCHVFHRVSNATRNGVSTIVEMIRNPIWAARTMPSHTLPSTSPTVWNASPNHCHALANGWTTYWSSQSHPVWNASHNQSHLSPTQSQTAPNASEHHCQPFWNGWMTCWSIQFHVLPKNSLVFFHASCMNWQMFAHHCLPVSVCVKKYHNAATAAATIVTIRPMGCDMNTPLLT